MHSTSLDDLPAELITQVLYSLASPTALLSLIQASARCYRIFLLSRSDILLTTLREVLQPEIKSLVLLVHEAYHLPSFDGIGRGELVDSQTEFTNKFSRDEVLYGQAPYLPTPHFVVPQLRTVCTMEYFVEDYTNWVSNHLCSSKPYSRNGALAIGMLPPPQAHQNLSSVERSRLQRAFLRFEIFCTAMNRAGGHERRLLARYTARYNNNRFLNILQPWEREEFVCILDYLAVRLEGIFDTLETDFVERMTETFLDGRMDHDIPYIDDPSGGQAEIGTSDLSISIPGVRDPLLVDDETDDDQPRAPVDHYTDFFTTKTKRTLHAHYITRLITMGLPFLRRLFQSRIKDQRRLVLENLSTDGEMAKLVAETWINRDQSQLLRRHGEDESARECRNYPAVPMAGTLHPMAAGAAPGVPTAAHIVAAHGPTGHRDPENERILTFDGDRLGKPNYAFLWTHGFTSVNVCSGCDYLHRSLGYVFWDVGRLKDMGLVEHGHGFAKWPNRRELLKRRRRSEEKSAQQRLGDMGFVLLAEQWRTT
jgi:hypothetical protein